MLDAAISDQIGDRLVAVEKKENFEAYCAQLQHSTTGFRNGATKMSRYVPPGGQTVRHIAFRLRSPYNPQRPVITWSICTPAYPRPPVSRLGTLRIPLRIPLRTIRIIAVRTGRDAPSVSTTGSPSPHPQTDPLSSSSHRMSCCSIRATFP